MSRIVVVGAGVGGLRATESLRAAGHTGELIIVGDEPYAPYQRPPLSKSALAGTDDIDRIVLRQRRTVADVEWRLGRTATAVSLADHTVTLTADGDDDLLSWDGLVIASGLRPRRLDLPGPTERRFAVRSYDDTLALRSQLRPGADVVVIGAGFLGCEIAATAVSLGCHVNVVAPEPEPMTRPLGTLVGAALRRRHEAEGVRFHLGRLPKGVDDGVVLDDGTRLPADVVVEAVGSVPATDWLAGSGLDLSDGVRCDSWFRAVGADGPRPDVVAVGDVARFPHPLAGGEPRRIEHFDLPPLMAKRAAPALVAGLTGAELDPQPFAPVPSFWSDQYDVTIQCFGAPELADEVEVTGGDADGPFVAAYRRAEPGGAELVAAVGVGTMSGLMDLRTFLAARWLAAAG